MIAAFLATRLGRALAAAAGLVLALVTFGAWQRRQGAQAAQQAQKDADHDALARADRADGEYRAGGGAAGSLHRGEF